MFLVSYSLGCKLIGIRMETCCFRIWFHHGTYYMVLDSRGIDIRRIWTWFWYWFPFWTHFMHLDVFFDASCQ